MATQIKVFDTTLRDGEQSPGCSMNLQEKLEMAKQLERLGVDIIEAGFAIASPEDFESVRSIAETVKNCTIASLSRAVKGDIERAYDAVKVAAKPRIHTFIATSDIHMQYKLKMSPNEVIARTAEMVSYAKSLCDDVEFSAEDASRSNREFLVKVLNTAIESGATVLNIPDTVGYATPDEMYDLIYYIKNHIITPDKVDISVHCHNDLGLGVACTLASVKAGATQIECTVNGIGERAGNASLEELVMNLNTRSDLYNGCYTNVNAKQIYRSSKLLSTITGVPIPPNKPIIGANAFAHESGIHQHGVLNNPTTYEIMSPDTIGIPQNKMVLGKHSGKHAFEDRLITLGYNLTPEEIASAFAKFKELADKKKTVSDKDIEALVGNANIEVPQNISYVNYHVQTGNTISAIAAVKLCIDGVEKESSAMGGGPIDACFKAIDSLVDSRLTLDNYTIQSVTEGEDALGEVIVKMKRDGESNITGRGLSTDIIEASIKAYINALNKE